MNARILKKTATTTGYDEKVVNLVNKTTWKFLADLIRSGNLEGLMLIDFGTFGVKEGRKEYYQQTKFYQWTQSGTDLEYPRWLAQQRAKDLESRGDSETETADL